MDWMKLDLSKASLIKREVDIALNTLSSYISGNDPSKLMNFVANIQNRVHEMDSFCTMYSEDERVMLIEKQRLRLRTAIQAYINPENVRRTSYSVMSNSQKDEYNRSVGANTTGTANNSGSNSKPSVPPPPPGSSSSSGSTRPPPPPSVPPDTPMADGSAPPPPNMMSPCPLQTPTRSGQKPPRPTGTPSYPTHLTLGGNGGAHSVVSLTNNPSSKKKGKGGSLSPPKSPSKIYAWETPHSRPDRGPVAVDDVCYLPSKQQGFYHMADDDSYMEQTEGGGGINDSRSIATGMTGAGSVRYIDFQIVLTADELQAVAARRKAVRMDVKHYKQTFSAKNVHAATPYVDPKRINVFRQDTPEKWIDPKGVKPAIKRGML